VELYHRSTGEKPCNFATTSRRNSLPDPDSVVEICFTAKPQSTPSSAKK
jgi:hypothetical protein